MQTYLIPSDLCLELERMLNSFWWGSRGANRRGIHWASWERMCYSKGNGGLGFRRFHGMNLALLAKNGCRFLTSPEYLVSRIFQANYFLGKNFLEAQLGHNPSYVWRSIHAAKHLLKLGARWLVGNCERILMFKDP